MSRRGSEPVAAVTVSLLAGLDQDVIHPVTGDSRSSSTASALFVIVTVNLEKRSEVVGILTLRRELWWLTYIFCAQ